MRAFIIKKYFPILLTFLGVSSYAQMQLHNGGSIQLHANANIGVKGNITNNGSFNNNLGKVWLNGNGLQTIDGNNIIQVNNIQLNNSAGMKLDNELQISSEFTFVAGIVLSDRSDTTSEFVHFLAGSFHSGSGNTAHIDGVIKKTGNTAFDFPTGDDGRLMPISITAPTQATDEFRAYYSYENPFPNVGTFGSGSYDPTINNVSTKEY